MWSGPIDRSSSGIIADLMECGAGGSGGGGGGRGGGSSSGEYPLSPKTTRLLVPSTRSPRARAATISSILHFKRIVRPSANTNVHPQSKNPSSASPATSPQQLRTRVVRGAVSVGGFPTSRPPHHALFSPPQNPDSPHAAANASPARRVRHQRVQLARRYPIRSEIKKKTQKTREKKRAAGTAAAAAAGAGGRGKKKAAANSDASSFESESEDDDDDDDLAVPRKAFQHTGRLSWVQHQERAADAAAAGAGGRGKKTAQSLAWRTTPLFFFRRESQPLPFFFPLSNAQLKYAHVHIRARPHPP